MLVQRVTSVSVIAPNPAESRRLYTDAFGLPLKQLDGEYFASEDLDGCGHFGVWPLEQAAQSCFGTMVWPDHVPVPQVTLEFEVAYVEAVAAGAEELRGGGYQLLHDARREPWPDRGAAHLARRCPRRRLIRAVAPRVVTVPRNDLERS
jgi:catechol 2,3-dioxygenase-like lactoylglutathione lyase family enzyme